MTVESRKPLIERIRSKEAKIGVIGLGYVGLPIAIKFAERGFSVTGIEKEPAVIGALQRGRSFVPDVTDDDIATQLNKNFFLVKVEEDYQNTSDALRQQVAECDIYVICVPTPLKHTSYPEPNIEYIEKAAGIVEYSIRISEDKEKLVILESTTYPGCTEQILLPRLRSIPSMSLTGIHLIYSPERTNPGGGLPFWEIPKIVGAFDPTSFKLASELYSPLFEDRISEASSMQVAETIKCAENAYRLLSISFANKMAQLLEHSGADIWNTVKIIKEKDVRLGTFFPKFILRNNWPTEASFFEEVLSHNGLDREVLSVGGSSISTLVNKCVREIQEKVPDNVNQQLIAEIITRSFCQLSVLFFHQLARFCNLPHMRIKLTELISGILTKPFGLNLCFPGPGTGGHCIPVDPLYLYWKAAKEGISIPLIWEAYQIDEKMPDRVVALIRKALNAQGRRLSESSILMLGVTYKENVPDIRESKAINVLKTLLSKDANLYYCDPVFARRQSELFPDHDQWMDQELYLGIKDRGTINTPEKAVRFYLKGLTIDDCISMVEKNKINCVVIFANHDDFLQIHMYERIISNKTVQVIDTRNAVQEQLNKKPENVFVLGKA